MSFLGNDLGRLTWAHLNETLHVFGRGTQRQCGRIWCDSLMEQGLPTDKRANMRVGFKQTIFGATSKFFEQGLKPWRGLFVTSAGLNRLPRCEERTLPKPSAKLPAGKTPGWLGTLCIPAENVAAFPSFPRLADHWLGHDLALDRPNSKWESRACSTGRSTRRSERSQ